MAIRWHEDDPVLLLEAIRFTSAETGFNPRLIEKDYFCSVLLQHLAAVPKLTFKGGTCLSKIHSGFYRLSEDLDFSISTDPGISRAQRSRSAAGFKGAISTLPRALPVFRILEAPTGANGSSQYNAVVGYASLLDAHVEPVSVEVGIREPTLSGSQAGAAKTAVLNPLNGQALVEPFTVPCLSYREALAEKLRAALTRREVAIRDFFDIDFAVKNGVELGDPKLVGLLKLKVKVPGTGPVRLSPERMAQLKRQLGAQLRPVLRQRDFAEFNLDRAIAAVSDVAQSLG